MENPEGYWNSFDLLWCIMNSWCSVRNYNSSSFRISYKILTSHDLRYSVSGRLPFRTISHHCIIITVIIIEKYWFIYVFIYSQLCFRDLFSFKYNLYVQMSVWKPLRLFKTDSTFLSLWEHITVFYILVKKNVLLCT